MEKVRKAQEDRRDQRVTFLLTPRERARLDKLARLREDDISSVLRSLLREAIKAEGLDGV